MAKEYLLQVQIVNLDNTFKIDNKVILFGAKNKTIYNFVEKMKEKIDNNR